MIFVKDFERRGDDYNKQKVLGEQTFEGKMFGWVELCRIMGWKEFTCSRV